MEVLKTAYSLSQLHRMLLEVHEHGGTVVKDSIRQTDTNTFIFKVQYADNLGEQE